MTPTTQRSLRIYTIYDKPSDFPHSIVVRGHTVFPDPIGSVPDPGPLVVTDSLELARALMALYGLHCLGREPGDEPQIVESWV